MSERNAVVAVYGTHIEAEGAVKELQRAGIDMRTLSIVGKDSHTDEHVVGHRRSSKTSKRPRIRSASDRAELVVAVSSALLSPRDAPSTHFNRCHRR
jgi:hypothetical protein